MSLLKFQCDHQYPSGFSMRIQFETSHLVTSLFGPSGSGKTSVLEMIAGLKYPQRGIIEIDQRVVTHTEQSISVPLRLRNVGMVFQDHLLFPHYTVEGNLRYGYARRSNSNSIEFDRVVQVMDLGHVLNRYPKNLSGGEKQRVALGRALLSNPKLLLMDEPLAALDETLKFRILNYLERALEEWKIPTLFVSHGQAEVRRFAEWVIVLDQGKIVSQGSPQESLGTPLSLQWKNSTAPDNLLKVDEIECGDSYCTGRIGHQILKLPLISKHYTPPIYVEFPPGAVFLSKTDISNVSARNHLKGTVQQIVTLKNESFLAIDIGQILWAEITNEALKELQIGVGSELYCLLKTHSLKIIE